MNTRRKGRLVAAIAAVGLLATPLITIPAGATPAGDNVVINEASPGAKFVELYNPTDEDIDLAGLHISYYSTAGNPQCASQGALTGTIAPKGYYLVHMAKDPVAALPQADAVWGCGNAVGQNGGFSLSIGAPAAFTGNVDHAALNVVDYVGLGSHTNFETQAATSSGTSAEKSVNRTKGADSDNNTADFTVADISPKNSASDPGGDPEPTDPPTEPTDPPTDPPSGEITPIADIQGTGAASPLQGQTVTTEGFVTATYPEGGKNGIYIQSADTGGTTSHAAPSVGLFVYDGSAALPSGVEIGDFVEITGSVSEFNSSTQITVSSWKKADRGASEAPQAVTLERLPVDEAGKEALEGMLVDFSGPITVTDNYQTGVNYGEIGVAFGDEPLRQPSDLFNPTRDGNASLEAIDSDNAARKITIDDGRTSNWANTAIKNSLELPYISTTEPVRTGAEVTLVQPAVVEFSFDIWRLQPVQPATTEAGGDRGNEFFAFENDRPEQPKDVGGDVSISGFNVLNYFTTTADDAGCTSVYRDRAGNPITANSCDTVRGAANAVNLGRQQETIVTAINTLDASVVSLEEIENSAKNGKDRDDALATLTAALNAADSSKSWDYVRTPATGVPALADEDVIRTAFIYQTDQVKVVGESRILNDQVNFSNAREPLAQEFVAIDGDGGEYGESFVVIVNHFKSKGSGTPAPDPWQGNANADRINQANALGDWANEQWPDKPVFIVGDLNSYSAEDPILKLGEHGYTRVMEHMAEQAGDDHYLDLTTYQFQSLHGTLDQALGNEAALDMVNDADVYAINAPEAIALEYSRYNNYVTLYHDSSQYRSSDHDPVKIGVNVGEGPGEPGDATPAEGTAGNVLYVADWATTIATHANTIGAADQILAGDFDGDGVDTPVLRSGATYTFLATNRSDSASTEVQVGAADSLAVTGDFDGDGVDDLALRGANSNRFEVFYTADGVVSTTPGDVVFFGRAGDEPLAGDFDGDGLASLGVHRANAFHLSNDLAGGVANVSFMFGTAGDRALVGDFDGDGVDTVAIERGSRVYLRNSLTGGQAEVSVAFGRASDVRVVGDWFDSGVDTLAAYRP